MLRRPPGDARWSHQHQKLLLAFAVLLIPWLPLADAQQQNQQAHAIQRRGSTRPLVADDAAVPQWDVTQIDAAEAARETLGLKHKQRRQSIRDDDTPRRRSTRDDVSNNRIPKIPDDASALATLAPAPSVRAPHPPRHHRPSSVSASGLASPQIARSLEDWEVEDFVLLATVDGDLYASDRKTGKERWHLEVDHPMVETTHYRSNNSVLDDDYDPVDHYIWAVEPNRDGGIYLWIPDSDAGVVRTPFTMKHLVEDLSPYANDNPAVVYTGDKKTTMVTLDAATGRVLKWFGSGGSHVNAAESCLKPNTLYDRDAEECSSTGTITLGRTEYTVGIQKRDGQPIATLKYWEWGPNNFDNDLYQQYHVSLDSRYITSQHDGKVYAFDYARAENAAPLFSHKFSAPVARVFDVCRPWDAPLDSNPELVVLPQPPMPAQDESIARIRSSSIFLNQTESGSWYAMSGRSYPLIVDAPVAQISRPDWWDLAPAWESISPDKVSKALIGTHYIESLRTSTQQLPSLPPGQVVDGHVDIENDSMSPSAPIDSPDEPNIITKVKLLPQSAANSITDFFSNPIVIICFFCALVYNEKKFRRAYSRYRARGSLKETYLALTEDLLAESLEDDQARKGSVSSEESEKKLEAPKLDEPPKVGEPAQLSSKASETPVKNPADESRGTTPSSDGQPEKKKKAHRGRRGGVKHRPKGKTREGSQSRDDEADITVDEAVKNAKRLGDGPNAVEPDVRTVANDVQAVTGSIIRMGSIEVDTDDQLGTGSNGTLVFAGKFDGREVAVKRMLIQFYDIASQETRLLRESDDHPNGELLRDEFSSG